MSILDNEKYNFSYSGNQDLLNREKISIVGSRKPTKYSKMMIQKLSSLLAKYGVCIVSGGAMGIDAIAHNGASSANTISVLPCGINVRYPAVNKNLLNDIEKNGLLISQFDLDEKPRNYYFVQRNEVVVALGKVLVVGEADLNSGTMRSVEFALKMKKDIYVLPQRIGESEATNRLIQEGKAKVIYDIEKFVLDFVGKDALHVEKQSDEFLVFCDSNPSYDELLAKYPSRVFEAELAGEITVKDGRVFLS
jgi:DNA processing protein